MYDYRFYEFDPFRAKLTARAKHSNKKTPSGKVPDGALLLSVSE